MQAPPANGARTRDLPRPHRSETIVWNPSARAAAWEPAVSAPPAAEPVQAPPPAAEPVQAPPRAAEPLPAPPAPQPPELEPELPPGPERKYVPLTQVDARAEELAAETESGAAAPPAAAPAPVEPDATGVWTDEPAPLAPQQIPTPEPELSTPIPEIARQMIEEAAAEAMMARAAAPGPSAPAAGTEIPLGVAPEAAGATEAEPAGATVAEPEPGFVERGRIRRRLRYLRRVREVQLRDIGGFVVELHRFGRERPDLVQAKVEGAQRTAAELRGLEQALRQGSSIRELREAGIGGACDTCGAVHGSEDRYCASCGEPLRPELFAPDDGAEPGANQLR